MAKKKVVEEIKEVIKGRKKKRVEDIDVVSEAVQHTVDNRIRFEEALAAVNKRIDKIVDAIDNAKRVKGL
jgi:predicted thioredoxin/glutaredoxin